MIPYDKKLHFAAGLIIAIIGGVIFAPNAGLILATAAGVLKEIKDYLDYGGPDVIDCLATWIGGGIGYAIMMLF